MTLLYDKAVTLLQPISNPISFTTEDIKYAAIKWFYIGGTLKAFPPRLEAIRSTPRYLNVRQRQVNAYFTPPRNHYSAHLPKQWPRRTIYARRGRNVRRLRVNDRALGAISELSWLWVGDIG